MPRPWTSDDDHTLRLMYERTDTPIQRIRDTLHRSGPDIHQRARVLRLVRPGRDPAAPIGTRKPPATPIRTHIDPQLVNAATVLRKAGFAPVYAQRLSDTSIVPTGLWVVGKKLLRPDEVLALAERKRKETPVDIA